MNFIQTVIANKIKKCNKIAIFFHEIPDFDALGSAYAFKSFILNKFPNKQVEIIGLDVLNSNFYKNYFDLNSTYISNEFLKDSLGIILDTANKSRVWTTRHRFCKEIIRIDHHPQIESFAKYEWINPTISSTCEMLAQWFFEWDEDSITPIIAKYLYAGIITDTGRFLYESTTHNTLAIASKLLKYKFNLKKLMEIIYSKSIKQLGFESQIIKRLHFFEKIKFAYAIIPKNLFNKYDIHLRTSMVHIFNNISELEVWLTIYYDNTIKKWRGSIRSKRIPINTIMQKFNGGGHKLAAGFTLNNFNEHKVLIKEISNYIRKELEG